MQTEKPNTFGLQNEIEQNLLDDFHDPDFREIYTNEFLNAKIATQIKVLREQRGWTQEELAEKAQMKQERITILENVNYESWTLNVLRRFAKAFDLRVNVSFEDFGSFLQEFSNFNRETLERNSFKDDPVFKKGQKSGKVLEINKKHIITKTDVSKPTATRFAISANDSTGENTRKFPEQPELPNLGLVGVSANNTDTSTKAPDIKRKANSSYKSYDVLLVETKAA